MSSLNSVMLGGQAAACTIPVVFGQCCFPWLWDEPEEAQCDFHTVPRPPDPSKHRLLHTVTHTHSLIKKGQICVCACVSVCVSNIKRDKLSFALWCTQALCKLSTVNTPTYRPEGLTEGDSCSLSSKEAHCIKQELSATLPHALTLQVTCWHWNRWTCLKWCSLSQSIPEIRET